MDTDILLFLPRISDSSHLAQVPDLPYYVRFNRNRKGLFNRHRRDTKGLDKLCQRSEPTI